MRIKKIIVDALMGHPTAFRIASKVYHRLNSSFQSLSAEGPEAITRSVEMARDLRGNDPGDYYEFGLFRGYTYLTAFKAAEQLRLDNMNFHGFDSFEGLPDMEGAEDEGEGQFFAGQFACSKEEVTRNLAENGMDLDRANLVEGYYSDSLTEELRSSGPHEYRRAAVVMLDCDLYSSTRDALQWVDQYVEEGTVMVFDDWHAYGGDPEQGQPKAFAEFLASRPDIRAVHRDDYEPHGRAFVLRKAKRVAPRLVPNRNVRLVARAGSAAENRLAEH